jgi:hypothetical protein
MACAVCHLVQRGMPRFETLTREQVMQIYAYVRAGARQALRRDQGVPSYVV